MATRQPKLRLDVGGGIYPKEGFINVDLFVEGAVKAPAWQLPYANGTVDELNCSHVLEHIEKRMVIPTLREFHRVLRAGTGLLTIEVPDLVWCCENWLAHQDDDWNLDALFGNQDPPGGQFHLTGFNHMILEKDLRAGGFTGSIARWEPFSHNQRCIHMEVFKDA